MPSVPHREPAVQSFEDLHRRPGIAGAFRSWQQLQGMHLESHHVVPGHLSAVFEAQNLVQAQLQVERPECGFSALCRYDEATVEPRQELLQHAVGCPVVIATETSRPELNSVWYPLIGALTQKSETKPGIKVRIALEPEFPVDSLQYARLLR